NIGKNQSAKARKEIEIAFKLIKPEDQKKEKSEEITTLDLRRLTYGKSPTKRGITNVLDAVLPKYRYASLAELNAILKIYNLVADRGKEGGIIFKKNGLIYRILDEKGNKIGVPIKASSVYNKPTLSYLETKFKENEVLKQGHKKSLKTTLDWIMLRPPKNLEAFKEALEKEKINLVVRQNTDGIIYGLTYIDHKTKCVFNGSDIGKEYSAKSILATCGIEQLIPKQELSAEFKISTSKSGNMHTEIDRQPELKKNLLSALDAVLSPEETFNYVPYHLRKQKKKKRKSP
ncbi:relaxase, partial [Ginsengibacter hankyongi]|uniref:relaxase n=1 Tax=Ginsengibacter hankyongi TaxID=2607284 RepID=UPI001926DEAD